MYTYLQQALPRNVIHLTQVKLRRGKEEMEVASTIQSYEREPRASKNKKLPLLNG